MSIQQAALRVRAGNGPPAPAGTRMPTGDHVAGIREQAADIIEEVLAGTDPYQARARNELSRHLAAHPGRPEIALAEHLLAIRGLALVPARRPEPVAPQSPGGTGGKR